MRGCGDCEFDCGSSDVADCSDLAAHSVDH
jgi:hypothetical protein